MKALVLPLLIAFFFLFNPSFAQTYGKYLMKFYDNRYTLAANKNGQLAIATQPGEVALASPENGIWRKTYVDKNVAGPTDRVKLYNVCYFNADTAFVSGVIYNNESENRSEDIYHTTDGGKTWRRVKFGLEGPIDAAAFLDNGEAWLSVGYGDIAYTRDYGFTWTRLTVPDDTTDRDQRFSRIFFNKRAGIIGSRRNKLAYTNDNCKSWTIIPTPFGQRKWKKADDPDNHDNNVVPINRVAIYKDYLLVKQENRVFYSDLHKIQWIPLPQYKDFCTDPENSALFFIENSGTLIKCNNELHPVFSIDSISKPLSITCKNGCLYILGRNKVWQVNTSNQLIETPLYSHIDEWNDKPVEFGSIFTNTSYQVGHIGNQIYLGKEYKWKYAFTLPFATDGGVFNMKGEDVIWVSRGDSVFSYSISGGKLTKTNGANEFRDFSAGGIRKIVFIKDFGSCFRVGSENMEYTLQNNQYVLTGNHFEGSGDEIFSRNCPDSIDQTKVAEFVQKIPAIYSKQMRADELGFTQEEYDSCKRSILKFKSLYEAGEKEEYYLAWKIEDPDFIKLTALVDSVKTISPELLSEYLQMQKNYSTVHYRFKIKLVNNGGNELEIKSEDYISLGFYCPWEMNLNNLYSSNTAVEINRFIKDVYPNFLRQERRVALIQGLVKLLYRKWKDDE